MNISKMENLRTLMDILDNYNDTIVENDYLKGCNAIKNLHITLNNSPVERVCTLTLNRKIGVLLTKVNEINPDFIPLMTPPYTSFHLERLEWICRSLRIDPDYVYTCAIEQLSSSHGLFFN